MNEPTPRMALVEIDDLTRLYVCGEAEAPETIGEIASIARRALASDSADFRSLLRDVSRHFAGDHVNADVVLGEIRRRLDY